MKRLFTLAFFVITVLSLFAATYSVKTVPNVHIENRTRYISNPDGIISPQTEAKVDSILGDIWDKTSVEAVSVVVDNIDTDDYDTFATDLFMHWGIGKSDNDNGLLILVVKDLRKAVIRTGYGVEGALPDIISSRILREEMFPRFKEGDYDGGVYYAVSRVRQVLLNPDLQKELKSKYQNDSSASESVTMSEIMFSLLSWGAFIAVVLVIYVSVSYNSNKTKPRAVRYKKLCDNKVFSLALSFLGFGLPLIAYYLNKHYMKVVRETPPVCEHCSEKMQLLKPQQGLMALSPVQTTESRIGAAEYDVWQCPRCKNVKILEYAGSKNFEKCPNCGARAEAFVGDEIISNPTYYSTGQGVHKYVCRHCGKAIAIAFVLPMLLRSGTGHGGGSGFGGGGFSGGSFGGGSTGGGGASGGW